MVKRRTEIENGNISICDQNENYLISFRSFFIQSSSPPLTLSSRWTMKSLSEDVILGSSPPTTSPGATHQVQYMCMCIEKMIFMSSE